MALKDKVVKIAYELKDKFTSRVGKVTGSIDDIGNASDKTTQKIEKNNKRSILSLRSLANGAKLASVALTALSASAVAAFNSFLNRSDEVAKLSTRLGISTEALSELKHVADLGGVSFQTLTLGFQRMTRRISEAAKGTGEAKGAIEELGLSAQTLNKLAPDQQFEVLADAIAEVENPTDRDWETQR